MYRRSLRQRVAFAFAACVAVISVAWGLAFFAAIRLSEDRVLTQQLQVAANSYPVLATNLRSYDEIASLPLALRAWAQTNPAAGLYEFEAEELHVAVLSTNNEKQAINNEQQATGNPQQNAYVVFDVAGIEAASSEDWWLLLVISGLVGTLGVLGFGLGIVVMRRAVAPVAQLAKAVADIDLEHLSAADHKRIESGRFGDDEVGVLARTIESTLERISAFVARERDFTSSASHELRTPITVITGALELLEHSELSAADVQALDRVRRATLDMKTTIEMFLCLARETDNGLYEEQFLVTPLVRQAIDLQRHLLSRKSVDVEIEHLDNPYVRGHQQAFSIAVNNLVRNAFEHTHTGQGPITILIKETELLITNQRNTNQLHQHPDGQYSLTEATSHGYGLGLGIVQRLCERNGWSFSLRTNEQRVVARLSW
ncbi:HAMP domain-containing histidine kinase [Rheinheimera riviphila]|uniref:histidine kinase n=1 Tax=Rheinheimera riviphila TaxID=1834037 RepID=A0A437QLT3_9GAMM|nr:HAMP domain-containing sensor histidine kinase [Rheinheimera riviphila]RVU35481.1 HAMP domain-containing histidine kinase [Rheinheimera riviphila]